MRVHTYGYCPNTAICIQARPPTVHNQLASGTVESEDGGQVVGLHCGLGVGGSVCVCVVEGCVGGVCVVVERGVMEAVC